MLPGLLRLFRLFHPLTNEGGKGGQFTEVLEVANHFIPVYIQIFMNQNVPKTAQGGQRAGKVYGQNADFAQAEQTFVGCRGTKRVFEQNHAVADINAALGRHFKIALRGIPQVAICQQIIGGEVAQRL